MSTKQPSPLEAAARFAEQARLADEKPNISRYVPQPGAQYAFHRTQARYRVLFGGNRGGKTYCSVADDVLVAIRRHPFRQWMYADRPLNIRLIGSDFERGVQQVLLPLFMQFLPSSFLTNGNWEDSWRSQSNILTLHDGTKVSFMSYEQDADKFQGVPLDHVHLDEEPPKAIWDESMMRLLDHDGTWTLSETPVKQLEWVEDEIIQPARDDPAGTRTDVFDVRTEDNVHLSEVAVQSRKAQMSAEQIQIRFEGNYTGSDRVFPSFTGRAPYVINHQMFIARLQAAPEDWVIYESMDHGTKNPTAWTWTAVHRNGSIVTFGSLYQAMITIDVWVERVKEKRRQIGELLGHGHQNTWKPYATFGDPAIRQVNQSTGSAPSSVQREYATRGIPIGVGGIVAARTGNQGIGLAKLNLLLRPLIDHYSAATGEVGAPMWQITEYTDQEHGYDSNGPAISEMRRARVPKQTQANKETANVKEQIRDKDNHWIDAFKYLILANPALTASLQRHTPEDRPDMVALMGATGYPVTPDRGGRRVDPAAFASRRRSLMAGDPDQGQYLEA